VGYRGQIHNYVLGPGKKKLGEAGSGGLSTCNHEKSEAKAIESKEGAKSRGQKGRKALLTKGANIFVQNGGSQMAKGDPLNNNQKKGVKDPSSGGISSAKKPPSGSRGKTKQNWGKRYQVPTETQEQQT